jgi:hypothetical protein
MSNPSKRPLVDILDGTCDPLDIFQKRPHPTMLWGPPGSRYSELKPSMPPPATTTPSQPQPKSACALNQSTEIPQLPLTSGAKSSAPSVTAPARQLEYLEYLHDGEDMAASSSNPEDPSAQQDDLRGYPPQSQALSCVTIRDDHNDSDPNLGLEEANSDVHGDQTLPDTDTDTHDSRQRSGPTVTSKYQLGLATD